MWILKIKKISVLINRSPETAIQLAFIKESYQLHQAKGHTEP